MAAHETHHGGNHHPAEDKPTTSFRSSFWFVVILVGLFIAAVNFVDVMSHDEGGHGTEHATSGHAEHAQPQMEATATQTLEGETGVGKPVEDTAVNQGATGADTPHGEHH